MKTDADTLWLKKQIKETKPTSRNPIYNSHLYWSQKSFNIIDLVINELSAPGDTVFDPFMGSGVTLLEAVRADYKRNAIGVDVNEMPTFIVKTILKDLNNGENEGILTDFMSFLTSLDWYYETVLPDGRNARVTKVLFDKPNRTQNEFSIKELHYQVGKEKGVLTGEDISLEDTQRFETYKDNLIVENVKLIPNSKIAVGKDDHIADIFTPRNFSVLNEVVQYIREKGNPDLLRYLLMSVLHLSKITDTHSNSQWPLWIPKVNAVEKNIIDLLRQRIKNIRGTMEFVHDNYSEELSVITQGQSVDGQFVKVLMKGSQNITNNDIPDDSVDLVITDPPYMDQVLYSEYMQLYQPFLNFQFNLEDEIVVSNAENRGKNKNIYFDLLNSVFNVTSRKAKEDAYMALYFHDSSLLVWNDLLKVLELNGFKYITQQHIPKTRTLKNILSPKKSLSGDAILLFQNTKRPVIVEPELLDLQSMVDGINSQAKLILAKEGRPLGTPELYDLGVMEFVIQNGWLQQLSENFPSLVEIFEQELIWIPEPGVWDV